MSGVTRDQIGPDGQCRSCNRNVGQLHEPTCPDSAGRIGAGFVVKDSGARQEFNSGMVRDTEAGKIDYTFLFDGPLADRYAAHMTKGAEKYGPRNWMNASSEEERDRFKRSAARHFRQWLRGDTDEDHLAAIVFNLNAWAYVEERLRCRT